MPITYPYSFVANTLAEAAKVQGNFDYLKTYIDGNLVLRDGTTAFTGVPSGPATDPSSANHLVRKAYVDAKVGVLKARVKNDGATFTSAGSVATDLGLSMSNWTMPTLVTGQAIRIALFYPWAELVDTGSGPPTANVSYLELRIRQAATTTVQYKKVDVTTTGYTPTQQSGGLVEALIVNNTDFAAGTTMSLDVTGQLQGDGEFKLQSSSNAPILFYAHVI